MVKKEEKATIISKYFVELITTTCPTQKDFEEVVDSAKGELSEKQGRP